MAKNFQCDALQNVRMCLSGKYAVDRPRVVRIFPRMFPCRLRLAAVALQMLLFPVWTQQNVLHFQGMLIAVFPFLSALQYFFTLSWPFSTYLWSNMWQGPGVNVAIIFKFPCFHIFLLEIRDCILERNSFSIIEAKIQRNLISSGNFFFKSFNRIYYCSEHPCCFVLVQPCGTWQMGFDNSFYSSWIEEQTVDYYLSRGGYVSTSSCWLIGQFVYRITQNYWIDFNNTWWTAGLSSKEEPIKFWFK